ncbi:hypothetical protein U0070_011514 [Myodes glareolus]|uniref:Uncharacterized protein n=1 Tax=Myodes glareolus TaxID=447135 RepID=A0AAW0H1I5_MYOGA
MAKAAATLLVLLSCLWSTVQADAHILSCSFTVNSGSIRIESIQCSVDGVSLHSYDNDNTRKEGNAPKKCADLFSKLEDIGEELRSQLHITEKEGNLTRGNLITVKENGKTNIKGPKYWKCYIISFPTSIYHERHPDSIYHEHHPDSIYHERHPDSIYQAAPQ